MKSISTCRGDLLMRRRICVSVSIFFGIRLRMATFSGRMSCFFAMSSSSAKIFSLSRMAFAGRPLGMLIGMRPPPYAMAAKACFRSSRISSMFSNPTEKRIMPPLMPASFSC